MSEPFWVRVPRDFVMVHGPDAGTYLQGQLSQELRDLAVGEARWSFVLQPTGKVDTLVRVLRSGDHAFVLDTDAGFGETLVARLNRFRIRVKVDIEPIEWTCLAVRGAEVAALPGSVAVPAWWGSGRADGVDLLGPEPVAPTAVAEGDLDRYESARVAAGWPSMGADITGDSIPAETGLVEVAVSFTKGCYPGQELVERMDSRGATAPRLLRALDLTGPAAAGDRVLAGSSDAGVITSAAGSHALALVRRTVEVPAEVVVNGHPAALRAVGRGVR
ncbi:MAG TPA: hypothetical protein VF855_13135 [Acidimicrobiales bacterium]